MEEKTQATEEKNETKTDVKKLYPHLTPFKPKSELTPEEIERQHQISLKGGLANKQRLAKKKTMNELAKALLDKSISRSQAVAIIGEDANLLTDDELTVSQVLNVAMVQESLKGNVKAYESIRDTAGYTPKKELEITTDIMTDTDRELIARVSSRLNTRDATG